MTSTTPGRQFLTIDFRLLDSPSYCAFMRSMAFPLYLLLRRNIWRGKNQQHPIGKVNELYADGYLVCAVARTTLAEKLGVREPAHISRHLASLVKRGMLRTERTGRQNIYVLGTWADRGKAGDHGIHETFFLEQNHAAEQADVSPEGTSDVSPEGTSDVSPEGTSDVSPEGTSDVSLATPSNKEVNRERNREVNRARISSTRPRRKATRAAAGARVPQDNQPYKEIEYVPKYKPLYLEL